MNKVVPLNVCNFIKETPTHLFSCKTCENFQNIFFTEHHWWLLLNTPNHILHFSKKNKVNYIKLMKHPKTFIMRIMLLKGLLLRFFLYKNWTESSLLFWTLFLLHLELLNWIALLYCQLFNVQVWMGMLLVLVNTLSRGETALVFDFYQRSLP